MKTGIIYMATNTKNGKSYIGQTTKTLKKRQSQHKYDSERLDIVFYRAIRKYGWKYFKWQILHSNIPYNKLNDLEIQYIVKYNTYNKGYNSTPGGRYNHSSIYKIGTATSRRQKGRKLTEETKRKISEAHKGMKHTKKSKLKMSKSQSGRKHTAETKRKMSKNYNGGVKYHTEKTKLKMSESRKGKKHSPKTRHKISHSQIGKKVSQKTKDKISKSHCKNHYSITSPCGKIYIVKDGIVAFCKRQSITKDAIYYILHNGPYTRGKYKGWKIIKV